MVTIVAMDISSRRLCEFHMKGLKLINSFELGENTSGWAANTATCLFPVGRGVWVCRCICVGHLEFVTHVKLCVCE